MTENRRSHVPNRNTATNPDVIECDRCGNQISLVEKQKQILESRVQLELAKKRAELESRFEEKLEHKTALGLRKIQRQLTEARKKELKARSRMSQLAKKEKQVELQLKRQKTQLIKKYRFKVERELKSKYENEANRKIQVAKRKTSQLVEMAEQKGERNAERKFRISNMRETERLQKNCDNLLKNNQRLSNIVTNLQRRLDQRSNEEKGEDAELDLCSALKARFSQDKIERVPKGKSGCDIVLTVIEKGRELEKIVLERKDVKTWSNAFIEKAKINRIKHDTQFIVIVSPVMPRGKKDFCKVNGILVVHPRLALDFVMALRDLVVKIGELRMSGKGRDGSAKKLYEYVLSNKFINEFQNQYDCVTSLRELSEKERDWHANHWKKREGLMERAAESHRNIQVELRHILAGTTLKRDNARCALLVPPGATVRPKHNPKGLSRVKSAPIRNAY